MNRLAKIAAMIVAAGIVIGISVMMPKETKAATPPDGHDASYYNLGLLNNNSSGPIVGWLRNYGKGYFTSTDGVKYQFTVVEVTAADTSGHKDPSWIPSEMPSNPFLAIMAYEIHGGMTVYSIQNMATDACSLDAGTGPLEARIQAAYSGSSAMIDHEIAYERSIGAGLLGLSKCTSPEDEEEIKYIDYDTFKSEFASGTATASIPGDKSQFFDLKGHAIGKTDAANQMALAQAFAKGLGKSAKEVTAYGVFPRRDLSTSENGSKYVLTWKNLSVKAPGTIYAVCYNQTDGAYVLTGTVDATGKAVFPDFKLRTATNVTIFTLQ